MTAEVLRIDEGVLGRRLFDDIRFGKDSSWQRAVTVWHIMFG